MDAFDKDFKNALDRERAFEATDADWQDMAARLSRPPQPSAKPWWSTGRNQWAALLLLLLLGTSWGWWQTARDLARLKSSVQSPGDMASVSPKVKVPSSRPNLSTNNHVSPQIEQPTATIPAQPANISHDPTNNDGGSPQQQHRPAANTQVLPQTIAHPTATTVYNTPKERPQPSFESPYAHAPTLLPPLDTPVGFSAPSIVYAIPPLPLTSLGTQQALLKTNQIPPVENNIAPIVKKHHTKQLSIGLSTGGYAIGNGRVHLGSGHLAALQGKLALTRHLTLCAEVAYTKTYLRINPNDRFGWHLPLEPPPAPGFDLRHIHWQQHSAAAGGGLRWQWRPERRWQPFAGAMALAGRTWGNQLLYVFDDGTGDELSLQRPLRQRNDVWLSGHAGVGFDWQIIQRFTIGAELFTRYANNGEGHDGTWSKGVRAHVHYKW